MMVIDRLLREADPVADWRVDPESAQARVMLAETLATPRPGDAGRSGPAPQGRRGATRLGWRRRPVLVASATTAVAAIAAVIGVAAFGDTTDRSAPPRPATLSGQEILLAAATTAQQQPEITGTYWYFKVASRSADKNQPPLLEETWVDRDGRYWYRTAKFGDKAVTGPSPMRYVLGARYVPLQQFQELPTSPDALRAWLTDAMNSGDVRNSGGPLSSLPPKEKEKRVFYGLISLVSQLPAPPKVRAAAFQALSAYPNVTSLGPVDGGQGLRITFEDLPPARLVIDPVAAQIRVTDFYVTPTGALRGTSDGGSITLNAEWTNSLPG